MSEKITDLMREKFGFSKVSQKISIKSDDTVYQVFEKVSKYIYKNGLAENDWTQQDYIDGIKSYYMLENYDVISIEKVSEAEKNGHLQITTDELNDINVYAKFKETYGTTSSWRDHIYLVSYKEADKEPVCEVVFVDPQNTHIQNDKKSWVWRSSAINNLNFANRHQFTLHKRVQLFNAKIIIGSQKLIKNMNEDLLSKAKLTKMNRLAGFLGLGLEDIKSKYFNFLLKLQSPFYRSRGYKYLFRFDSDFAEAADKGTYNENDKNNYLEYAGSVYSKYGYISKAINNFMCANVIGFLYQTYSLSLQAEHELNDESNAHARFYQQKKNITSEKRIAMNRYSNSWKNYVKGVEIDNDVDLHKLAKLAPEIKATLPLLPQAADGRKPTLRFRKLRNLKALGVFTNFNDTIALDFRITNGQAGIQSFIHEYGHFLDYHSSVYNLSIEPRFVEMISNPAIEKLEQFSKEGKISKTGKYGIKYYSTPTELFARAFELYVSYLGLNNSLISDPGEYQDKNDYSYQCFKENESNIYKYFDEEFPALRKSIIDFISPKSEVIASNAVHNHQKSSTANINKVITTYQSVEQLSLF